MGHSLVNSPVRLLARSAALTRALGRSFTHFRTRGTLEQFLSNFEEVLNPCAIDYGLPWIASSSSYCHLAKTSETSVFLGMPLFSIISYDVIQLTTPVARGTTIAIIHFLAPAIQVWTSKILTDDAIPLCETNRKE